MCDFETIVRLQKETSKFLEIDNIFERLKSSNYLQKLFALFMEIFQQEHQFTITELNKIAKSKQVQPQDFSIHEHYKLNSHIFKSNLTSISNVIIEDIWIKFNSQMDTQSGTSSNIYSPKLFQIEEESQFLQTDEEEKPQIQTKSENKSEFFNFKKIPIIAHNLIEQQSIKSAKTPPNISPRVQNGSQSSRPINSKSEQLSKQSNSISSKQNSSNKQQWINLGSPSDQQKKKLYQSKTLSQSSINSLILVNLLNKKYQKQKLQNQSQEQQQNESTEINQVKKQVNFQSLSKYHLSHIILSKKDAV